MTPSPGIKSNVGTPSASPGVRMSMDRISEREGASFDDGGADSADYEVARLDITSVYYIRKLIRFVNHIFKSVVSEAEGALNAAMSLMSGAELSALEAEAKIIQSNVRGNSLSKLIH